MFIRVGGSFLSPRSVERRLVRGWSRLAAGGGLEKGHVLVEQWGGVVSLERVGASHTTTYFSTDTQRFLTYPHTLPRPLTLGYPILSIIPVSTENHCMGSDMVWISARVENVRSYLFLVRRVGRRWSPYHFLMAFSTLGFVEKDAVRMLLLCCS